MVAHCRSHAIPLWVIGRHSRCSRPCPLYPRERTFAVHQPMSAKGQKQTAKVRLSSASPMRADIVEYE
jgi:hypothetical protein